MFRNRRTSQKPNEELYANFKATFPQLATTGASTSGAPAPTTTSLTDALDVALATRPYQEHEESMKDGGDPTPRGSNEPWRFTPSLLDPNSFAFANFANQPPGYYTPTPGGTNTLYHSQAGDLHTPGFTMGLGTPLSMPTSEGGMHIGQGHGATMHPFHPHSLSQHMFANPNPFAIQQQPHHHMQEASQQHPPQPPPQAFAPHQFSHQPSAFEHLEGPAGESPPMDMGLDVDMHEQSPVLAFPQQAYEQAHMQIPHQQRPQEKFRWHVTLNAPTAMIKHADEIPVTYLNKGQAYAVTIVDTQPEPPTSLPGRYRTFIRISFEDEQQRQRPGACWQLWKEGRGINEAHQRGGRLQAVEYVSPEQVGPIDDPSRPRVELESASFDGFCVTWTPGMNGAAECSVAVRFNFLSTDFSHSKGVKGIPVRLCAKTERISSPPGGSPIKSSGEICFCKVKLFRDHGAERKLSNDVAHVKKTIDKLKQQIAQAEQGLKDFGKRRRSGSIAKGTASTRPGKVPKHKRTWSMSSQSDQGGSRPSAEEDLHLKLATLQDMFTSTRPASVLFLRGTEEDDPDVHPVRLTGEPTDLTKVESTDTAMWERQSVQTRTSSIVSPTPSVHSITSGGRRESFQQFKPPSRVPSNEWRATGQTATGDIQPTIPGSTISSPPDQPVKVQKPTEGTMGAGGWIEAVGVDFSYQPPPERVMKPVACFYVLIRVTGRPAEDPYYRAVYLMRRSLKDLVNAVASKCGIEPTQVMQTIRVLKNGIPVRLDDESVDNIPEGQDMTAEFTEYNTEPQRPRKREWDAGPTDIQVDGEINVVENVTSRGWELKLLY